MRSFEQRHPDVTFELDETNDQRLWPFRSAAIGASWFDNMHSHGIAPTTQLLRDVWSAAPWLAPSSIGFGTYDSDMLNSYGPDFLMPLAALSHVTFWTDFTKLRGDQQAATSWWLRWYATNRGALGGLAYELTGQDPSAGGWLAVQPWAGDHGYVFAFRQDGGPDAITPHLHGLDGGTTYQLTDVRSGAVLGDFTGAVLAGGGWQIALGQRQAAVVAIAPVT